jgi:hypothetical protein
MKTTSFSNPNVFRALTVAVSVAALLVTGCKEEDRETRSLVYLQPDGAATWTVLEWDIEPGFGHPEGTWPAAERDFLATAHGGNYPLKAIFEMSGATRSSTTVLKDTRPFEVYTLGEFRGIDAMFRDLYLAAGAICTSSLERSGSVVRWTLKVEDEGGSAVPGIEALAAALDKMQVVLTKGRFVEARGFKIVDDRTAEAVSEDKRDGEPETLVLAWDTEPKKDTPR